MCLFETKSIDSISGACVAQRFVVESMYGKSNTSIKVLYIANFKNTMLKAEIYLVHE